MTSSMKAVIHLGPGLFKNLEIYKISVRKCGCHQKKVGKKQNMAPMWKKLMKHVDIGEPTSFLDRVYLGYTQRECKPNEIIC